MLSGFLISIDLMFTKKIGEKEKERAVDDDVGKYSEFK